MNRRRSLIKLKIPIKFRRWRSANPESVNSVYNKNIFHLIKLKGACKGVRGPTDGKKICWRCVAPKVPKVLLVCVENIVLDIVDAAITFVLILFYSFFITLIVFISI